MCKYAEIFSGKVEKPIVNFFLKRPVCFNYLYCISYCYKIITKDCVLFILKFGA